MEILVEEWPEVRVRRNADGRVVAYAVPTSDGTLVWVYVPPRYQTEGLTYFGDNLLDILPAFLKRQAD